jgi:hypothetical protein
METLDDKRARLRRELQGAYDMWLRTSEHCARDRSIEAPLDVSGCRERGRQEWFDYLAAKERLVLAYSEQENGGQG